MCKNTCIEVWSFSGNLSRIQPLAHTPWSFHLREASHIDFVHEKRHMDVGRWGGGLAPVTFLGKKIVENFDS